MSVSQLQTVYSGEYEQQGNFNGRPYFRHRQASRYLFFSFSGAEGIWAFNSELANVQGRLYAEKDTETPVLQPDVEWLVYDTRSRQYLSGIPVDVRCDCNREYDSYSVTDLVSIHRLDRVIA